MGKNEKGQALIEFVLMAVCALGLLAVISTGFRRTILNVWGEYHKKIAAACPGCTPDPRYKFK